MRGLTGGKGDNLVHVARRSIVLLLAALLAAACGSRLDADVRTAALDNGAEDGSSGGGDGDLAVARVAGPNSTIANGSNGGGASNGGSGGQTSGGSGGAAGSGGGGSSDGGGGDTCVPSGASDIGITESEITLGEVGTISGPVPGLGQIGGERRSRRTSSTSTPRPTASAGGTFGWTRPTIGSTPASTAPRPLA